MEKKTTTKKLVLKKKTVQVLGGAQLNQVVGGISGNRCNPSEDYGCSGYCNTVFCDGSAFYC